MRHLLKLDNRIKVGLFELETIGNIDWYARTDHTHIQQTTKNSKQIVNFENKSHSFLNDFDF